MHTLQWRLSSSKARHWRGCVSQASSSQTLGAHLLLQQQVLSARPPPEERMSSSYLFRLPFLIIITKWCSNQIGNFVRAPLFNLSGNFVRAPFSIYQATLCVCPFQSIRQLCAHALSNLSSNFEHWPFHHSSPSYYSLCALFIMCIIHCAHCSIVLSLTLIKES